MSTRFPISRKFAASWQHHIVRYAFALPHCYRKSVIDVGSQIGFGSQLISYVSNSITLTDINESWLNFSKEHQGFMCPADFHVANFEKEFPEGQWQVATCFEVIEHLDDPKPLLENLQKRLCQGGKLIFSVPHMVANHEHKQLYDREKIIALISQYFTLDQFYEQDKEPISGNAMYGNLKCYLGIAINNK